MPKAQVYAYLVAMPEIRFIVISCFYSIAQIKAAVSMLNQSKRNPSASKVQWMQMQLHSCFQIVVAERADKSKNFNSMMILLRFFRGGN